MGLQAGESKRHDAHEEGQWLPRAAIAGPSAPDGPALFEARSPDQVQLPDPIFGLLERPFDDRLRRPAERGGDQHGGNGGGFTRITVIPEAAGIGS